MRVSESLSLIFVLSYQMQFVLPTWRTENILSMAIKITATKH